MSYCRITFPEEQVKQRVVPSARVAMMDDGAHLPVYFVFTRLWCQNCAGHGLPVAREERQARVFGADGSICEHSCSCTGGAV